MTWLDWAAIVLAILAVIDLLIVAVLLRIGRDRERAQMRQHQPVEDVGPIQRELPRDRWAA